MNPTAYFAGKGNSAR